MTVRRFKKIYIPPESPIAREFSSLQDNIEQSVNPVIDAQIVNGVYLKEIDLTHSVDNLIEHKLGREPLGWFVVRKFAAIDIYESLTDSNGNNYNRKKFINFQIPGTTSMSNVYFWIF